MYTEAWDSTSEVAAIWITGTDEAEKRRITGGWIPGGSWPRIALVAAITCAIARSMETLGEKYTRSMVTPWTVVLSIRWMLLTLLDSPNSV